MAIKVTRARARKIRSELELIQMDMRSFDNETWRRGASEEDQAVLRGILGDGCDRLGCLHVAFCPGMKRSSVEWQRIDREGEDWLEDALEQRSLFYVSGAATHSVAC